MNHWGWESFLSFEDLCVRHSFHESRSSGLERKLGGKFYLKPNIYLKPISKKYHEGTMKRTLERELKVPELVEMKADGTSFESWDCRVLCICSTSTMKMLRRFLIWLHAMILPLIVTFCFMVRITFGTWFLGSGWSNVSWSTHFKTKCVLLGCDGYLTWRCCMNCFQFLLMCHLPDMQHCG